MTSTEIDRRIRLGIVALAASLFLAMMAAFGFIVLRVVNDLRVQRENVVAGFERVVAGQLGITKSVLSAQAERAESERRELRLLMLRLEDDLRVILIALGGDPDQIPPEASFAGETGSDDSGRAEGPRDQPGPKETPKGRPSPQPSPRPTPGEGPILCVRLLGERICSPEGGGR